MDEVKDADLLKMFFEQLNIFALSFQFWAERLPKLLVISPEIVAKLSRLQGFYEREEVKNAEITAHSPIVRRFNLGFGVVEIYEDYDEDYLHFE